jgi:hypothetical protein
VISRHGSVVHESPLFRSLDAIKQAGIQAELVPGTYPWGQRLAFLFRSRAAMRAS